MVRHVCIHGHFYQPPRENPWLGYIELQDSAYPYHDWNERITAECYASNATARILNAERKIDEIVNNYARMSFNFGPTLLAWMRSCAPEVYKAVLEADRLSQQMFSGHGSAMAQAYNHMIMPLATLRDKRTQVIWGIRDFEYTFQRSPEGMWLPETAVDLETLDVLAEQGIRFTILAPHQAARVRPKGSSTWSSASDGIDPRMAYDIRLPSGRSISLFFYDDPISRAVAFEQLLTSGESFALRLAGGFSPDNDHPQLVNIATDGETYGHHHRFGEMALAYALRYMEDNKLAQITNYGEYLAKNPPTCEVEILENTSWSCVHGVERWRADCGCRAGGKPQWNQAWRAPLREALDWLRDSLAEAYADRIQPFVQDPWATRDDYIYVVHDRSQKKLRSFLARRSLNPLKTHETVSVLKLLELQRNAMLMFTSCGWFFNELSGIETVQVLRYAARTLQLAREVLDQDLEPNFLELLGKATSNFPEFGNGRDVYEKFVRPAKIDLKSVAAHYAISSLFEEYNAKARIYCYRVNVADYQKQEAGKARLVTGRARVTSEVIHESASVAFGLLHFGDHNINAGVGESQSPEEYRGMVAELSSAFSTVDSPRVIRTLDKHFGMTAYTVRSLFRDEQRKVLSSILESTLAAVESSYRQIYETNYPLMRLDRKSVV